MGPLLAGAYGGQKRLNHLGLDWSVSMRVLELNRKGSERLSH